MRCHRILHFVRLLSTAQVVLASTSNLYGDAQTVLTAMSDKAHGGWKVSVSREWDVSEHLVVVKRTKTISHRHSILKVLGPFPIHAREQHFLSPSFPLNRKYIPLPYAACFVKHEFVEQFPIHSNSVQLILPHTPTEGSSVGRKLAPRMTGPLKYPSQTSGKVVLSILKHS